MLELENEAHHLSGLPEMIMTSGDNPLTSFTMISNASSLKSPPTCKSDN